MAVMRYMVVIERGETSWGAHVPDYEPPRPIPASQSLARADSCSRWPPS